MKRNYFFLILAFFIGLVSCNKSSYEEINYSSIEKDVAVLNFNLVKNDSVMENLDSVFFTIDLQKAEIFNADSLPKGSRVDSLLVKMTFLNPSKVQVIMNDVDTLDYLKNPEDSISFKKPVKLRIVSMDGKVERYYTIKVNVHNLDPDSLQWNKMSSFQIPGGGLEGQKTVIKNNLTYTFVRESAAYKYYTPNATGWNAAQTVTFPTAIYLYSLQVMNGKFYILGYDKNVYVSDNGSSWTLQSGISNVKSLIGVLKVNSKERLLGLKEDGATIRHFYYDGATVVDGDEIDPLFPVSGYSNLIHFNSGGSQFAFAGGKLNNGNLTNALWVTNGDQWAILNNVGQTGAIPPPYTPREGAQLFAYYADDAQTLPAWILFGGKNASQKYLKDIYFSIDNGVRWDKAGVSMQLPAEVPAMAYASVLVLRETPFANQMRNWVAINTELPYSNKVPEFVEDAPYIYVFGGEGFGGGNMTFNQVWRAIINRLGFPVIP